MAIPGIPFGPELLLIFIVLMPIFLVVGVVYLLYRLISSD